MKFNKLKNCFIIAEISANHNQNLKTAFRLIKEAKKCGVDAVKFQTYRPDTLTIDHDNKYFRIKHPKWGGQTLYQLYKKTYTPWDWFVKLKRYADQLGLTFFSSCFNKASIDLLESIGVPFHKIASFELVDLPLIKYAAKTGKPLILSTGMASFSEIREAVSTARHAGARDIMLLKCSSSYPANPESMNLRTIPHLIKSFRLPVGLSDHTLGIESACASVCLGASAIEKHFTISRKIKTPDSFFSFEPSEMQQLVKSIRTIEKSLGRVTYSLSKEEKSSKVFRRSLFIIQNIRKNGLITDKNVASIRPGYGLHPRYLNRILGKRARIELKAGTPLKLAHLTS
jgi:pseudaminic acid synthase